MKSKWMSKRFYIVSTLLLLLIVFTAACGGGADETTSGEDSSDGETDSITFVAWGGTTQEAQEEG